MSRQEDAVWKPSAEFYIDRAMGLCAVTTKKDGRQMTGQYLTPDEAREWLDKWLKEKAT